MFNWTYISQKEAEQRMRALEPSELEDIGSPKWFDQIKLLYKCSLQAISNAKHEEDEFVEDFMVKWDKVPFVVHELVLVELWKEKTVPEIISLGLSPLWNAPLHVLLYHEPTLFSFLVNLFSDKDIIESSTMVLLDLIDYCNRKLRVLLLQEFDGTKTVDDSPDMVEIMEENNNVEFFLQMECISLLSKMLQKVEVLPPSVLQWMLNVYDIPMVIVGMLMKDPWQRQATEPDTIKKYIDGNWIKIKSSDSEKLVKVQEQAWLILHQLLIVEDCVRMHNMTCYRKSELLKLRPKLIHSLICQMPILEKVRKYLGTLNVLESTPTNLTVPFGKVPELRENLLKRYDRKYKDIAVKQFREFFCIKHMRYIIE